MIRVRAFTLIEVLISIVVLALGLLGLAAVFPVVVYQQRSAADTVQGISMGRSIEAWLNGNEMLNLRSAAGVDLTVVNNRRGWEMLYADPSWSPMPANDPAASYGAWVVCRDLNPLLTLDTATGVVTLGAGPNLVTIPTAQRLFPAPYAGAGGVPGSADEPRYVWDIAARRIELGERGQATDDGVQVAVFVRRVDASIRVAAGVTLSQALSGDVANDTQRRLPVAEDTQRRPTFDGIGGAAQRRYSDISRLRLDVYDMARHTAVTDPRLIDRTRVVVPGDPSIPNGLAPLTSGSVIFSYALQVGQKFVGADGVVYTVRSVQSVDDDGVAATPKMNVLEISPALSDQLILDRTARPDSLNMLFVPQVPVAVDVIDAGRRTRA